MAEALRELQESQPAYLTGSFPGVLGSVPHNCLDQKADVTSRDMYQHLQVADLEGSVCHQRSTVSTGCKGQAIEMLVKASTAFLDAKKRQRQTCWRDREADTMVSSNAALCLTLFSKSCGGCIKQRSCSKVPPCIYSTLSWSAAQHMHPGTVILLCVYSFMQCKELQ